MLKVTKKTLQKRFYSEVYCVPSAAANEELGLRKMIQENGELFNRHPSPQIQALSLADLFKFVTKYGSVEWNKKSRTDKICGSIEM